MKSIFRKTALAVGLIVSQIGLPCPVLADSYVSNPVSFGVVIDKKIRPINDSQYFDNIPSSQKVFVEKDQLDFEILIENTGNTELLNLTFKDNLPKYFTPSLYPGSYSKDSATIEAKIDRLGIGETKVFNIRGVVSNTPASDFQNQLVKQINKATVSNENVSDSDLAVYYIEKRLNPVTGNETLVLGSIVGLLTCFAAVKTKKLVRGY